MTSFSYNRPGSPPPEKTKWEWGGPVDAGYEWPPGAMQLGAFVVCQECGAAVSPGTTDRHTRWHTLNG